MVPARGSVSIALSAPKNAGLCFVMLTTERPSPEGSEVGVTPRRTKMATKQGEVVRFLDADTHCYETGDCYASSLNPPD